MSLKRDTFYEPEEIFHKIGNKINKANEKKEHIDYLTFVPDGEPTLDINLGKEIEMVKEFGKKIAVITNASLLWNEDVRNDLFKADWVSQQLYLAQN